MIREKERGDVDSFFRFSNSTNRFAYFVDYVRGLEPHYPEFCYALRTAYCGSDNLYRYRRHARVAFNQCRPMDDRHWLMNGWEQRMLANLPAHVRIYRAMTTKEASGGRYGVSWSLSKKVAEFFRDKYTRNYSTRGLENVITERVIPKSDIIAVFNERKEKEVIYLGPLTEGK